MSKTDPHVARPGTGRNAETCLDCRTPAAPSPLHHPPGATLHLGGAAWAHPDLAPALTDAGGNEDLGTPALTPYPGNPRRGDQPAITSSLADLGLYRAVITQRSTGHVLAGNHTLRGLLDLGADSVPVTWVDVDDTRAAAIVARDNKTSDAGTYDDEELLALLTANEEVLALSGYAQEDVDALLRADEQPASPESRYSRLTNPVQYVPTMEEPPPVTSLVDRSRTNDLIRQVSDHPDLPQDVRDFLVAGAQRHLTFNYARVAEFYAHADPDVQRLMEESALVIVDYDDAIRHGYAHLSERLAAIREQDVTERAAMDASGTGPTPTSAGDPVLDDHEEQTA